MLSELDRYYLRWNRPNELMINPLHGELRDFVCWVSYAPPTHTSFQALGWRFLSQGSHNTVYYSGSCSVEIKVVKYKSQYILCILKNTHTQT